VGNRQTVLFDDGSVIEAQAGSEGFRMLFLCGRPLREALVWKGSIVMNTREEIQKAFMELDKGTFIK